MVVLILLSSMRREMEVSLRIETCQRPDHSSAMNPKGNYILTNARIDSFHWHMQVFGFNVHGERLLTVHTTLVHHTYFMSLCFSHP